MTDTPRVDVLLYCHDGRGMGHVSRTVAIALAIQRIAPTTRTVILTGSEWVPMLAGPDRVEWLKLPSYRAEFRDGRASGVPGALGYSHAALTALRDYLITEIMRRLRPRAIVVDHYADGKNAELTGALRATSRSDTRWILGLRAIIGQGSRLWNSRTRAIVKSRYHAVFWYGDEFVTGWSEREHISTAFGGVPLFTTGYVSRALELARINAIPEHVPSDTSADAVAAFTWCSSGSLDVLRSLANLPTSAPCRQWHVALGPILDSATDGRSPVELLQSRGAIVTRPNLAFLASLRSANVALLHGGYNSITDIAWAQTPAVVVMRDTEDKEQVTHAACISKRLPCVTFLRERDAASPTLLHNALQESAEVDRGALQSTISIGGAAAAAERVVDVINRSYAAASHSGR